MSPGSCTAVPSAMVDTCGSFTTRPASSDAFTQAAPAGSTPTTRMRGLSSLAERGHARRQAAAPDGHHDDVDERLVLHDLHGDGALPRGHGQVVEEVHHGQPLLLGQPARLLVGLVVDASREHHLGAEGPGACSTLM